MEFELVSKYKPTGDQPEAIKKIVNNFNNGIKRQTLLGATGTGKTFTMANVIKELKKPTLVLAHNKTLAGQLYNELKALFPNNHVEYFISYYDYYQPEAYVVSSDTYIEKDASINEEIDELRHSATASLIDYDDVIVVASVSCIYGIGDPDDYKDTMLNIRVGEEQLQANAAWEIYNPHREDSRYISGLSDENILQPADFYIEGNAQYGVQAYLNGDIVWTQPIWSYQNDYFSTTLNQWDGKTLTIDEESGTILANAIAAGKKNPDNTFSGVMLGDWSKTDISEDVSSMTGLYGFHHGAMSYAFMEDGTGFIGKSGKGRILFDGNSSTITSNNYKSGHGGIYIDLDDSYQEFRNTNPENSLNYYIKLNATEDNLDEDDIALSIGIENSKYSSFRVTWDGSLYATNADIQGFIHGSTINISNGAFEVQEDGGTLIQEAGIDHASIDYLDVRYLSILQELGTSGTTFDMYSGLNNIGGIYGGNIYSPNIIGGTLQDPEIHIYLGSYKGSTITSNQYILQSTYSPAIYYYYKFVGSDTYQAEGHITRATFDERNGAVGFWYKQQKVSTTTWNQTGTKSPIYIHSGSYSSGPEVGQLGDTGVTAGGEGTAGFNMTAGNYGVSLKAHGGALLTVGGGTSGNVYAATPKVGNDPKCYFQLHYNNDTARLCNSVWQLELGTSPHVTNGTNDYDLRYAYFA